jgi:hypothetical protein
MTITAVDEKPCYLTNDYTVYLCELKDFVSAAQEMRNAQRNYFRSKAYPDLLNAKKLEAELDAEIESYQVRWNEKLQPSLNF